MRAVILPATARDVDELASFMRASDREECLFNAKATGRYNGQWSILGDLRRTFAAGNTWSMWWGNDLMAIGGFFCDPRLAGVGSIWFLGTDLADKHPIAMTRGCRRFLDMTLRRFDGIVGNIVPKHLCQRVAWLQHLGFDMREGEAQSMLQGHLIFWTSAPSAPTTTLRPR
jgi:hypothetical protein